MNEEATRSQYLQALMNQRKTFNASGNNLVNPSVSNDIGTLAAVNTNFQQGVNKTNIPTEKEVEETSQPEEQKEKSILDNIFGFVDDIAAKFGAGFVGAIEGIVDLAATGIAALGDATGWYDSKPITDFVETDYASKAAEWTRNYANYTPWGIVNSVKNLGDENYRRNWLAGVFGGPLAAGIQTLRPDVDAGTEYYDYNNEILDKDMGQFGQFIGGAAHSIGFMLPSIITGGASAGAGLGSAAVKGISLGTMGLGAAGKGSEEALNDGATTGQALGYGALSGGAEVLSEIAVGPVLAKVGLGTGKLFGVVGGKTVNVTSKSFIKELAKDAFEEGMEEVSTALVEPLFKSIYKGQEALDEYKDPAKFLFGVGGNFNESVLGQFTAGAATGGLMSGINTASARKTYGKEGIEFIQKFAEYGENVEKSLKTKNKSQVELEAELKPLCEAAEIWWNKAQNKLTEKQINNVRKAISNPALLLEGASDVEQITHELNTVKDVNKAQSLATLAARDAARNGYRIEFSDSIKDNAFVDKTNKVIKLNSKQSENYGSLLAHEYVSHILVENFGGAEKVNSLSKSIQNTDWYKQYENSLIEQYQTKDSKYKQLLETKGKKAASDYFNSEVLANYVQLNTKGSGVSQLQSLQKMLKKEGLAQKFLKALNTVKTGNNDVIMEEVGRVARIAIESSNNKTLKKLLKSIKNGIPFNKLTENEKAAFNNYKNVFEGMVKASKLENKLYVSEKQMSNQEKARLSSEILSNLNKNDTLNNIKFGTKLNGNQNDEFKGNRYSKEIRKSSKQTFGSVTFSDHNFYLNGRRINTNLTNIGITSKYSIFAETTEDIVYLTKELIDNLDILTEKQISNLAKALSFALEERYDDFDLIKKLVNDGSFDKINKFLNHNNKYKNRAFYKALDELRYTIQNTNNVEIEDIRHSKAIEKTSNRLEKLNINKNEFDKTVKEFMKETTAERKGELYEKLVKKLGKEYSVEGNVLFKNKVPFGLLVAKRNADTKLYSLKSINEATEFNTYRDSKVNLSDGKTVYFADSKGLYYSAKISSNWDGTYKADFVTKGRKFTTNYESFSQMKNALLSYTNVSNSKNDVINILNKEIDPEMLKEYDKTLPKPKKAKKDIIEGKYKINEGDKFNERVIRVDKILGNYEVKDGDHIDTFKTQKEVAEFLKQFGIKNVPNVPVEEVSKPKQTQIAKSNVEETQVSEMVDKNSFKTFSTTKGIVNNTIEAVRKSLPENYKISVPRNLDKFTSTALSKINEIRTITLQAKRIVDMVLDTNVYYDNVSLGKLNTIISKEDASSLQIKVENILKNSKNDVAFNKATKSYEMEIDRLITKLSEVTSQVHTTRVFTNQRRIIKSYLKNIAEITDDYVAKNGLDFLLQPIYKVEGNSEGSIFGYKAKGVKQNFIEVLNKYKEVAKDTNGTRFNGLPYYEEISNKIQDIIDSIGEPVETKNGRMVYGGLTAETLQLMREYAEMTLHLAKNVKTNNRVSVIPSAMQSYKTIEKMSYGKRNDILSKSIRAYKRGFSATYSVLREMFGGNSVLAKTITTDIQKANNNKSLYDGYYSNLINKKLKEFNVRKTIDKTTFNVNGNKITADQAMFLYLSLNVEANYNAINESGIKYYDANDHFTKFADKGMAEALKSDVNSILPDNYKKFADFLLSEMNSSIKKDYIEWYDEYFGKFNGRNEIGKVGENSYWTLRRAYEKFTNLEKSVSNPSALFSQSKSRQRNNIEVVLGGAVSTFNGYVNKLSNELYVKPEYRKAISILNTKVNNNESVYSLLKSKVTSKDISYLENTMKDILGALNNTQDLMSAIVSRFSVAKLSLNIGTMLKQFASIWTSNIPMRKSTKSLLSRIYNRADIKTEFNALLDEKTGLGGLKYRKNNSAVVKANADGLSNIGQKIADVGMTGISAVDLFTINTGVVSLMNIGQDQYGFKIGSQENINFVKEQWSEFELSQIGNGALSKSALARGDYGNIARALFGFLQGANRAALGSQINKIDLWERNKKVNIDDLKSQLKEAKLSLEEFKDTDIAELSEEQSQKYIKLQSDLVDAQTKIDDYKMFEIAGGNKIPVNMATGLIAQGIFIALINELMKHIKGKKDWDEWDIAELGTNLALSIGVDWLPLFNSISSMVQGYDITIPAVDMLNQFVDIFNDIKDGSVSSIIRKLVILVGDMTGIPFKTVYEYMYGAIKPFNPELAYQMNSVLYGTNASTVTKYLNDYIEKQDSKNTRAYVGISLDNFRVRSSDLIKDELTKLLLDGYSNVMPKQYMTEYTNSDGATVKLSSQEIESFRSIYDKSNKEIESFMRDNLYNSMTGEQISKIIKKLYDAYYSFAKAKVLGTSGDSRLSQLLVLTDGNIELAKYIAYLNEMSKIVETKQKTKKELTVEYVNKIKDLKNEEKLLLMKLNGYKLSDQKEAQLKAYLKKLGMDNKAIEEFLK